MKSLFWDLVSLAVLGVILTLGLWPFHSPHNDVSWLSYSDGLRFGAHGTVIGPAARRMENAGAGASGSLEISLQPRETWVSSTILTLDAPDGSHRLSVRQSEPDLELRIGTPAKPDSGKSSSFFVAKVFRRPGRVFLTIASGAHGTAIYIDGTLARTAPNFRISNGEFAGRLILGDSPSQPDGWPGRLFGLAIYDEVLTAAEVQRHFRTWTQMDRPEISAADRNIGLYLFQERGGKIVHDTSGAGVNLHIPEKYVVVDKVFLEPFWKEFSMSRSYWDSIPKNIVGFVPLGFCFYAALSSRKLRRAAMATVILGFLVSLTIEILQAYLPTRDSGTTDLITNTLGTYVGVALWPALWPLLARRLPWAPLPPQYAA